MVLQVEFFNPVDGEQGGSQQPASSGLPSRKRRDRDGRGGQHQRSDDDEAEVRCAVPRAVLTRPDLCRVLAEALPSV